MAKVSLTRLLVMKKIINKELENLKPSSVSCEIASVVKKSHMNHTEKEKQRAKQQAAYDALVAKIEMRERIARALIRANATTTVTIAGKEMTIAEAIDIKNNISASLTVVRGLQHALDLSRTALERNVEAIEAEVSKRITVVLGRDKAPTQELLDTVRSQVKEELELELLAHTDLDKLYSSEKERINAFLNEVDICLNEANASTLVEVDLQV